MEIKETLSGNNAVRDCSVWGNAKIITTTTTTTTTVSKQKKIKETPSTKERHVRL